MNSMYDKNPPYEGAAERETVTGWVCKTCRRFFGEYEHGARYCCASSLPCETEDCAGRRPYHAGYTVCDDCRSREMAERWAKLYAEKAVAWDGETPLVGWDDDRYFFGEDDIADHVNDEVGEGDPYEKWHEQISQLRLVLCEPAKPREFSMAEYLSDDLPDEDHGGGGEDFAEIDKVVNDFIDAGRGEGKPWSWFPSGVPVTVESVLEAMGITDDKVTR
jgi:hypothetical protein